jgi:hypothetical protein
MNKEQEQLDKIIADRRRFLKGAGLTAMGLAAAGVVGSKLVAADGMPGANKLGLGGTAVEAASYNDVDILNFALNLEYLEAEFYTVVTTGKTLAESGIDVTSGPGTYGPTTGGAAVKFDGGPLIRPLHMTFNSITADEQHHVTFLRSALGNMAVTKPAINLDALGIGYANVIQAITVARALEQTGESAYAGAAHLISSPAYLTAAAQILAIEAEHTGNLRLFCDLYNVSTAKIDDHDILPYPTGNNMFTVNSESLAPTRTTSEVLAIAFGSGTPGTYKGGFFPGGVNGNINTV